MRETGAYPAAPAVLHRSYLPQRFHQLGAAQFLDRCRQGGAIDRELVQRRDAAIAAANGNG
jgi:hypothetical protein